MNVIKTVICFTMMMLASFSINSTERPQDYPIYGNEHLYESWFVKSVVELYPEINEVERARKKKTPIIAKEMMKAVITDPMKLRLLKSPNSMIGAVTRFSVKTKATRATIDTAIRDSTAGDSQPHELPSIRASTRAVRLTVRIPTPV